MRSFLIFSLIFLSVVLSAQKLEIRGIVLDAESKDTIIGGSVFFHGMAVPRSTGLDGRFIIYMHKGKTLLVTALGYQLQEINIEEQTDLYVLLERDYKSRYMKKRWRKERRKKRRKKL